MNAAQSRAFLDAYLLVEPKFRKYDSADNRATIAERMGTYGIEPSITGCKRAIAELVAEDRIGRVDGLTDEDDSRIAVEKAEARKQRELAELRKSGIPTSASEYHAMGVFAVARRYKSEPRFRQAIDNLIAQGAI